MTDTMTPKQASYLLTLVNQVHGTDCRFLSQARDKLGLSSFQVQRITKAQASSMIAKLQAICK